MKHLSHICIIAILTFAAACSSSEKSEYCSVDADGWMYGDTMYLKPKLYHESDSTPVPGSLSLIVRHTNSYEYSNLWLRIDYKTVDKVCTDTINFKLADAYGSWLGKGIGVSFQQSQPILQDVVLDLSEPVRVTHIMRTDTLKGIEQVGVVFLPADNR